MPCQTRDVLVGREAERRTISTLLAAARVGDSRVLVLSGEPGIGKTALLAEADTLVADMRVLRAQGLASEQVVPFAGLLQLLRPVLPLLPHIPAPQAAALSAALLLDGTTGTEPTRFAVGAATLSLLARAAEDLPLAVFVDDAHLLDAPSVQALVFAARRLVSDAVAMLVCIRADEPGSAPWTELPTTTVTGLDLEQAGRLVSGALRPLRADQLGTLHRLTGGNPLGLLELGGHVDRLDVLPQQSALAVSDWVTRSFAGRVEALSDDARGTLLVAAADSTSAATVHAACTVLGLAEPRLAEAEDAGLVSVHGDRIEFHHPLVRAAVYGAADPDQRRAVHRALATVVPQQETDRLAWHLAEGASGPDEATAATLDRVATQAAARGAYAIACSAYDRAASLTQESPELARRLAAAGEAAWLAGLADRSMELLDRALAAHPGPGLLAHIQELRGAVQTRCGSLEQAVATLRAAAAAAEQTDPDAAVRLYADAVHAAFYLASPTDALLVSEAIERLLPRCAESGARLLGSMASGMALVINGSGAQGIARVREATYPLVAPDDVPTDSFRLPLRVQGALWLRESGPEREVVGEAIAAMREQAALGSLPYLLMHIGRDLATTDQWDDAETAYAEAIQLATETGQTTDLAMSMAGLACLDARRGREQACREGVAAAEKLCERHQLRLPAFWLQFAQGDLAAGLGDAAAAADHYEQLEAALATSGLRDPDQSCAPELVEAYVQLGRVDDAISLATAFATKAAGKGHPFAQARAERALGLCAAESAATEHLQAALTLHAQTLDRYEAARTELALGARLRRDRHRIAARPPLRAALETFERLGATPWAERAAQELAATGETVRRREASAMDELTPQERQIAQLLARGRTTREAAAALFLSPKTVEYHLRHVYLKLDIRSRSELAQRFGADAAD